MRHLLNGADVSTSVVELDGGDEFRHGSPAAEREEIDLGHVLVVIAQGSNRIEDVARA